MSNSIASDKKSGKGAKFLWDLLDRVMFIGIGALGAIATTYITGILKVNPPVLVAMPTYNTVDAANPVAAKVGGLSLDYKMEEPRPYGVLRVDIANEGRGPAEDVRFQVKLDPKLLVSYDVEPDFRVYRPAEVGLEGQEFYAELATLPAKARDFVALKIEGDGSLVANARIKLVNDAYEGKIERLKIGD